jgi:hypothetical protein
MNKIQKISLTDYLNDPTDVRLKIFVSSMNPSFVVTKSAAADIRVILEDYRKDNDKSRLKLLTAYLGASKAKTPKNLPVTGKLSILNSVDPRLTELKKLNDECAALQRQHGGSVPNPTIVNRINELKLQMQSLETELGMTSFDPTRGDVVDPKAIEDYEKALVVGVLGPWDKEGTFSWEILRGHRSSFMLRPPNNKNLDALCGTSGDGVKGIDHIIKLLEKHSGQRARKFDTKVIFGQGNNNRWSGIQFLETGSGLGWGTEKVTEADGNSISLEDIYNRPDLQAKVI